MIPFRKQLSIDGFFAFCKMLTAHVQIMDHDVQMSLSIIKQFMWPLTESHGIHFMNLLRRRGIHVFLKKTKRPLLSKNRPRIEGKWLNDALPKKSQNLSPWSKTFVLDLILPLIKKT